MATIAPLVVITGPTASGKSGLALELAERYGGEIICADSRTVYEGMDIGTAKPSAQERSQIPHHLLDVVKPNEHFNVADFQRLARQAISDIRRRKKIPFLVGGTGLYVDSIVLDYEFGPEADLEKRKLLEGKLVEELLTLIKDQQIEIPSNSLNKRHLIRAIEQNGLNKRRKSSPDENTYVVSIATEKETLETRIRQRANDMFAAGVVSEARRLGKQYGWDSEALSGNIYPILREVIEGRMSERQAKELFVIRDRQLAKRQLTWLRRHDFVHRLPLEEARQEISHLLDRFQP